MNKKDQIEAVRKMQEYINEHIKEPITLSQLSKVAGYSPGYVTRIFKTFTGKNPFDYIRVLRLSQAAMILRDSPVKVLDVALDFLFDSHEGFTRSFSSTFGVPPKGYSMSPKPIPLFMPYPANDYKNERVQIDSSKLRPLFCQVIERPERKIIIKRAVSADSYNQYCLEVEETTWSTLEAIEAALYEPIGLWLPIKWMPEGTSRYVLGVEVPIDYTGHIPIGFDCIDVPKGLYMIFQSEPFASETIYEEIARAQAAIKCFNPLSRGYEYAENEGPCFQLRPKEERGYIEARPVKKK